MGAGVTHTLVYTAAWPLRIRLARKKEGCVRDFFSYKAQAQRFEYMHGSCKCLGVTGARVACVDGPLGQNGL